jgi:hypothetical protein
MFLLIKLSYPGWEHDFFDAMSTHKDGYDLMVEKQKMHDGDRSHPRLVSLDICSSFFNYDGWKKDKPAEEMHLDLSSGVDPDNALTNSHHFRLDWKICRRCIQFNARSLKHIGLILAGRLIWTKSARVATPICLRRTLERVN